jgi:hypothetical protein
LTFQGVIEVTMQRRTFLASVERLMAPTPRFLLEDVLGVRITGVKNHSIFYLTPEDAAVRKAVWPQDHVSHRGTQVQVEVLPGSEVLARITMPFVDPALGRNIGSRFAAIHSNPPALTTGSEAAIVQHPFGKGQAVWVACGVEGSEEWVDRQLPQVAVPATVRVQPPPGQSVRRIVQLPQQTPVPFTETSPTWSSASNRLIRWQCSRWITDGLWNRWGAEMGTGTFRADDRAT